MRLNLGCGNSPREGWTNVDLTPGDGVDIVCNLDDGALPLPDDSVDESFGSHVLEHLHRPLDFMAELWRVTKPGGRVVFQLPYGSSDDAWEDPTHTRPYFIQSAAFFGQPAYWRADYGYTADWSTRTVQLDVPRDRYDGCPDEQLIAEIQSLRNVVRQMTLELVAEKPQRERVRLNTPPPIVFRLV